jgi:hypothetical protein
MNRTNRRSLHLSLIAAVSVIALAGCQREDPRVKALSAGITKDSAMTVMEIPGSERPVSYLINGQFIETFVVRRTGVEGPRDSLSRSQTTPVVVIGGQVAGWGWKYWDSVGAANGIPVKPEK